MELSWLYSYEIHQLGRLELNMGKLKIYSELASSSLFQVCLRRCQHWFSPTSPRKLMWVLISLLLPLTYASRSIKSMVHAWSSSNVNLFYDRLQGEGMVICKYKSLLTAHSYAFIRHDQRRYISSYLRCANGPVEAAGLLKTTKC